MPRVSTPIVTIDRQTARRFLLGRTGLWPGRRYAGLSGVEAAITALETLQIDPINVAGGRSQDLVLFSRVEDYAKEWLDELLYTHRLFVEYGGILLAYPVSDLPALAPVMRRMHTAHVEGHDEAVFAHVRDAIRMRGPIASREFTGRAQIEGGFSRIKDTQMAIYRLSLAGEIVTFDRRGTDRRYHLWDTSPHMAGAAEPHRIEQSEQTLGLKALRDTGLASATEWARRLSIYLQRRVSAAQAPLQLQQFVDTNKAAAVQVEGSSRIRYVPTNELPALHALIRGEIPSEWSAAGPHNSETEATLLAPLDNLVWDRARMADLFEFDYVWEIYKPAATRKWGYYTLPVLWGDRLAARIYPHMGRSTHTLEIRGLWLEPFAEPAADPLFAAIARAVARLARWQDAGQICVAPVANRAHRTALKRALKDAGVRCL